MPILSRREFPRKHPLAAPETEMDRDYDRQLWAWQIKFEECLKKKRNEGKARAVATYECYEEIPMPQIGGFGLPYMINPEDGSKEYGSGEIANEEEDNRNDSNNKHPPVMENSENVNRMMQRGSDNLHRIIKSTSETVGRIINSANPPPIAGPVPLRFPSLSSPGFAPL
ncbi:MAG: hypothetical protein M1816_007442 [Peltula sp. TS41687]|nr:MAG: hypothetical protein M1816_007442 [Peltula sp. TS41687]